MSSADVHALAGTRHGPTGWRTVTQADIDALAALAGDRQWIHVDVERARRESPFGETIAHGTLSLALIDGFRDELLPMSGYALGVNYGFDRVRFPAPLRAGARVRATMEIPAVDDAGEGWIAITQRFTVEAEGEPKPVCVADSLVRVRL